MVLHTQVTHSGHELERMQEETRVQQEGKDVRPLKYSKKKKHQRVKDVRLKQKQTKKDTNQCFVGNNEKIKNKINKRKIKTGFCPISDLLW